MSLSNLRNNKGLTLVELLGALVILSIVLTGFFSMFIQSASFQNINESNMVATNLARLALEDVRALDGQLSVGEYGYGGEDLSFIISSITKDGKFASNDSYYLKLIVEDEPNVDLYKVTVEIYNDEGQFMTKTYDYIEVGV
ncbi:type IV pilus modification PilV family protein [Bacillaceae bacterium W0354]